MGKMRKRPWLAALLNAVFPGIGYIYNGKRKVFGYILVGAVLVSVGEAFYLGYINQPEMEGTIAGWIVGVLFIFAFAYDAYTEAKEINRKKR